jgi:hypothetical protein
MSRNAEGKKALPAVSGKRSKKVSAPAVADGGGWFERLKRLRLRLKRQGLNFQVLLEDPLEHLAEIKREAAVADSSEAAALRAALKAVLDRHASSRKVLVHLRVLEKALRSRGLRAFEELPPELMRRAMFQLDTLVSDWSPAGLAALRSRLIAAMVKREGVSGRRGAAEQPLSDFGDGSRLQVAEGSVTTFMEVNEQWERSLTGTLKVLAPSK